MGNLVLIFCTATLAQTQPQLHRYEYQQVQMGSLFTVVLYADDEKSANTAAKRAFARVEALNGRLSDYDPESELMRFCRSSGPGKPMTLSDDLFTVLTHAQQLSRQTSGAFDVTVGPIVKLWRRARRQRELPSQKRLAEALALVGHQQIILDADRKTAELGKFEMRLDLGGIAKGFAADEVLKELTLAGIQHAMVAASGDVVCGFAPPGQSGWRVAVAPLEAEAKPSLFLRLAGRAVSTSGDAFQHVEIDGKRYSHIVDPKTGLGLVGRSSVTVVAPRGIQTDSLASAVSVLGPTRGIKLIDSLPEVAALIVTVEGDKTCTYRSSRWKDLPIEPAK